MIGKIYKMKEKYSNGEILLVKITEFTNNKVKYKYIDGPEHKVGRTLSEFNEVFTPYFSYNTKLYKANNNEI